MSETPPEAGYLLSLLSHELRTPLNAIVGYGDLLEGEITGPLTPGQREQVGRIRASAWELLQLIEDILCLTEIEGGQTALARDLVDAADVVEEAIDRLSEDARRKGLTLRVEGPERPVILEIDRARLRQILTNLLAHSIRSTDVGMAVLSFESEQGQAHFHLRDTGPGIPPERQASLFDPLAQARSESGFEEKPVSLGLCVSRRLARLMGGDLTLESGPGQGNVFTVVLPLNASKRDPSRQP
jgi:signal transduction histidine kinase